MSRRGADFSANDLDFFKGASKADASTLSIRKAGNDAESIKEARERKQRKAAAQKAALAMATSIDSKRRGNAPKQIIYRRGKAPSWARTTTSSVQSAGGNGAASGKGRRARGSRFSQSAQLNVQLTEESAKTAAEIAKRSMQTSAGAKQSKSTNNSYAEAMILSASSSSDSSDSSDGSDGSDSDDDDDNKGGVDDKSIVVRNARYEAGSVGVKTQNDDKERHVIQSSGSASSSSDSDEEKDISRYERRRRLKERLVARRAQGKQPNDHHEKDAAGPNTIHTSKSDSNQSVQDQVRHGEGPSLVKEQLNKRSPTRLSDLQESSSSRSTSSGSSESGSSSDSDSDDDFVTKTAKPMFVRRDRRKHIAAQEAEDDAKLAKFRDRKLTLKAQKVQAAREYLDGTNPAAAAKAAALLVKPVDEMPDDTDGVDSAAEYQEWRKREFARLFKSITLEEAKEAEDEERARRRGMTDAEVRIELAKQGRDVEKEKLEARKLKPRLGFLQKYHHKGAFYIDDDTVQEAVRNTNVSNAIGGDNSTSGAKDVRKQNLNAGTGFDRFDKKNLPKILQVRGNDFFKKGRSKHTHLADVDTSKDSIFGASKSRRR